MSTSINYLTQRISKLYQIGVVAGGLSTVIGMGILYTCIRTWSLQLPWEQKTPAGERGEGETKTKMSFIKL